MRNKKIKDIVLKVTSGIFSNLTDLTLYITFLTLTSFGKTGSRGVYDAFRESDELLKQINYKKILRVIQNLNTHKLVNSTKYKNNWQYKLSRKGEKRIFNLLPRYKKERTWHKRLYTITYDIPTKQNRNRDRFRRFLKSIGAAPLAESVFLITYNPRENLRQFIGQYNMTGLVLVANIGSDGSIGDEKLENLLVRIYKLNEINKRYSGFIEKCRKGKIISMLQMTFEYYSILKDDPQLPFELLPKNWLGDKANKVYNKYKYFLKNLKKK